MRRLFLLPLLLVVALSATGQVLMPAHWSYSVSNPNPKVGEEIDLIFSAEIDKDWYLYANEFVCEDGPNHTTMTFKAHPSFELVGKIRDIKPQKKHDKIFDCDVMIYRGVAEFRQTIKVLQNKPVIQGNTDYQVCTDVDGRCIPFDEDFSFDSITASGSATQGNGFQSSGQNPIPLTYSVAISQFTPIIFNSPNTKAHKVDFPAPGPPNKFITNVFPIHLYQ
jgi:thiol:disulfide interchange protein DsbD